MCRDLHPVTHLPLAQALGSGAAFFLLLFPYTAMYVGFPLHTFSVLASALLRRRIQNPFRIPTMLISRLYLNLRTFQDSDSSNAVSPHAHSTLKFASNRILGNIGAPLNSLDGSEEEEVECPCDGEVDGRHVIGGSQVDLNDLGRESTVDTGVA